MFLPKNRRNDKITKSKNEVSIQEECRYPPRWTRTALKKYIITPKTEISYHFTKTWIHVPKLESRNTEEIFRGTQEEKYAALADNHPTDPSDLRTNNGEEASREDQYNDNWGAISSRHAKTEHQ